MRSKNYDNQVDSFTPLQPHQMVRVALVEGIKPGYGIAERVKYLRLLKDHVNLEERHLDALWNLLQQKIFSPRQESYLNFLIDRVAYNSKRWKGLDYKRLKKEGVIIEHDGQDLSGLVRLLESIGENKVVFVPTIADMQSGEEVDYRKHVSHRNTFLLNGIHSVRAFAERKELVLSEEYRRSHPIRGDVWDLLLSEDDPGKTFYFLEALHSTTDAIKDLRFRNRAIARIAHKKTDGTNVVWHSHDNVETGELYSYFLIYNKEILQTLGDMIRTQEKKPVGDRYYGTIIFEVPKRTPIIREDGTIVTHDGVVFHYWPDILGKRHPLDWMNTDPVCNDPDSRNRSNLEERTGKKMVRIVPTHDIHTMMISLARIDALGISLEEAVNNFSPIPSLEYSGMVDKFRYNLAYEIPQNGKAPERKYVGEVGIEILIHELWKQEEWTFERMFNPAQKVGRALLRAMYV